MAKSDSEPKKLYRSEKNRVFGGVAAGLGEYFDIDPTLVRVLFVLVTLAGGSGILIYLILWVLVPSASKIEPISEDTVKDNIEEIKNKVEDLANEVRGLKEKEEKK